MAAGIGSRFHGGIKQLTPVGPNGEAILEYSIRDAVAAGFNKIILVIRREIESAFRSDVGKRIEAFCSAHGVAVVYAYQELDDMPGIVPQGRTKPWGTGQAVLAARHEINEPFAVINADDYYGPNAYILLHDWLSKPHEDNEIAMVGFVLKKTLSATGGVTRGICKLADDGKHVAAITETRNILRTEAGIAANGVALDENVLVSMNMWAFPAKASNKPKYIDVLMQGFYSFFTKEMPKDPMKCEFLLPEHIGQLLKAGKCTVEVLKTDDEWIGVTYQEDRILAVEKFKQLKK